MSHIEISKAEGTWTGRAGGAVLAESKNELELREGDRASVAPIIQRIPEAPPARGSRILAIVTA